MNNVMSGLDVLQELEIELDQVKPEQVEFRATKIDKVEKGEKIVATLENEFLKRLWCLKDLLRARAIKAKGEADNAMSPIEEKDKLSAASRDAALADLVVKLFWTQLRRELDLFNADEIGLRADWKVVFPKANRQHPLIKLLGLEEPED